MCDLYLGSLRGPEQMPKMKLNYGFCFGCLCNYETCCQVEYNWVDFISWCVIIFNVCLVSVCGFCFGNNFFGSIPTVGHVHIPRQKLKKRQSSATPHLKINYPLSMTVHNHSAKLDHYLHHSYLNDYVPLNWPNICTFGFKKSCQWQLYLSIQYNIIYFNMRVL